MEATLAILGEVGFSGLSIDGVAARAGVGKATIYRHWEGKADLVVDAFRRAVPPLAEPDTGNLRDDLCDVLGRVAEGLALSPLARIIPSMVEAAERDPELRRLYGEFGAERRAVVARILVRAQARGDLPGGLDRDLAVDLLIGPVFARRLVTRMPLNRAYAVELVDVWLRAFGAPGSGS